MRNDKTVQEIKLDFKRKLNIQQRLRDNKFLSQFFSSANTSKETSKINSIDDNKNKGLKIKNKTLQLLEYQRVLPKIKKINQESEKALQTDIGGITGRNNQMLSINKNGLFIRLIDEKNKNKSGSLETKIFSNESKNRFFFNGFLRNVTYDTLKNNDKKPMRRFNKSNFILDYNYEHKKILNKSSDGLKYNLSSNPKNINEYYDLNSRSKSIKNNIIKINSNYNIYKKNNNNFFNNNNEKKKFNKQSTSFHLESNDIKAIKPEKSLIVKDNSKENEIVTKTEQNYINDMHEAKNPSIEKNKNLKKINLFNIKGKKMDLSNMKFNKTNMNDIHDLLKMKKLIFDSRKLPKLKLKFDK